MNDNEIHSLLVSKKRENILASLPITISAERWSQKIPIQENRKWQNFLSLPLIKLESQESMEKVAQGMRDYAMHHLAVTEHGQILETPSIHDYYKYLVFKHTQ